MLQELFYGLYVYNVKFDMKVKNNYQDIVYDIISAVFTNSMNNNAVQIEQSSINTLIDKQNVEKLKKGEEELTPYSFDKTLFLAVYDRIKPVHMSKRNYIDAVIKVMEPCLY